MAKRNPLIAVLLSLFLPGTGQLYNRQPNKAILLYAMLLMLPIIFVTLGWQYHFRGLAALVFFMLTLYLLNIGDALLAAVKIKGRERKPAKKWALMFLLFFLGTNVYAIAKDSNMFGVRAFVLPANSMAPALEAGDYIMVKMNDDESLKPAHGDIVMFRHQRYPFLLKRIVAVGGETIEGKDGKIYVKGNLIDEPYAGYWGRREHLDAFNRQHATGDFGPITVPADHFFVMGDNRDNSFDSRDPEFGLVARDAIRGKPLYIYWSRNKTRVGREIK